MSEPTVDALTEANNALRDAFFTEQAAHKEDQAALRVHAYTLNLLDGYTAQLKAKREQMPSQDPRLPMITEIVEALEAVQKGEEPKVVELGVPAPETPESAEQP